MMLFTVTEHLVVASVPDGTHGIWHQYRVDSASAVHGLCVDDREASHRPLERVLLQAPEGTHVGANHVFLACSKTLFGALRRFDAGRVAAGDGSTVRLLTTNATEELLRHTSLPRRVGFTPESEDTFAPVEEQVVHCGTGRHLRLAIVNVLHSTFGDAVLSLRLFELLRARLASAGRQVHVELLQHPTHPSIERLLLGTGVVDRIRHLPISLARFAEFDAYIDLSRRRMRSDRHWADDWLERLGVDPTTVAPESKRTWRSARTEAVQRVRASPRRGGQRVVLVHGRASREERSLTERATRVLVARLLESHDVHVATALPLDLRHPRFHDWSPRSRDFAAFTSLIGRADAFVSVDTCLYHIADAFDVPGVVLFTNVKPEHRIAYYPYVEGMTLEPAADGGAIDDVDIEAVMVALERVLGRRRTAQRIASRVVTGVSARQMAGVDILVHR